MVNQILDFQKIEQSNTLSITNLEIGPYVENIFSNYQNNAELQNIYYSFENKVGSETILADPEAV
jgi:hypothetical protein